MIRKWLEEADAVVIGAGAGLSLAAGFTYTGKRFHKYFSDFEERYGLQDMYSGGFYPFQTVEEYWAYWSRYVYVNRYQDPPKPVYNQLLKLVADKDYFVLTTNVDHCFQKAGFDKQRLFYTQGDFGLWQCAKPCHQKTYENESVIRQMVKEQSNMKVPSALIPKCPVCGGEMAMNLRADQTFVEDSGWHRAYDRYKGFLKSHQNQRVLFMELGVGMNTPGIIKYSFWQMVNEWENARYLCMNFGEAQAPEEIKDRSLCINADISEIIAAL